jgi:hypothetical protein
MERIGRRLKSEARPCPDEPQIDELLRHLAECEFAEEARRLARKPD